MINACKTTAFDPNSMGTSYISFGNGGGFTGAVINYFLTPDGLVFKEDGGTFVKIKNVGKNAASQSFSNIVALGLDQTKLNTPGNRYYFIEYKYKDNFNKLVWSGEADRKGSPFLMYEMLNALVEIK